MRAILTAILPLVLTADLHAQTRIPDEPSCARCQIRSRALTMLGSTDGPGSLRGLGLIRLDGAGRYWISHPPDLPLVFDSAGKVVATPFRKGQGPNEFAYSPSPMPLPGDSTLAFEHNRATVLGPDLRAVRVIPFPGMLNIHGGMVVRWPHFVLLNGYAQSRATTVQPLNTVSFAGNTQRTLKSFGSHPGEAMPAPWEVRSSIVRDGNNFWVAPETRYRLTLWDMAGKIVRVLERKPSWFAEPTAVWDGPNSEPRPLVSALSIEEQGLLWVFVNVAAPTWREAWPKIPEGASEISADAIQHEKMYRTNVEVIDPKTARVVARSSLDQFVVAAFPGRRAAVYHVGLDGAPHITILRLTLEGR